MLNAAPITDAIASVLLSIPELNAAMGGRISAFHFRLGQEHRLAEAIYKMPAPSMLVAWEGTKGGNFDGQTIWKHRWGIYYRMGNAAGVPIRSATRTCGGSPATARQAAAGPTSAYLQIYPGLDIMDTPSIDHELDEDLIDRFKGVFIIPEIGDN